VNAFIADEIENSNFVWVGLTVSSELSSVNHASSNVSLCVDVGVIIELAAAAPMELGLVIAAVIGETGFVVRERFASLLVPGMTTAYVTM
jgi:hypothetical protein